MPGGHGTGEKPLHLQSNTDLWLGVLGPPVFLGGMLVVTFLGTWQDAVWRLWLGRAVLIGFLAFLVRVASLPRLRELRRRARSRVPDTEPNSAPDTDRM